MKATQKEYSEAISAKNQVRINALSNEMMETNLEVTKSQFNPMILIMLITIPLFCWQSYHLGLIQAFMTIPYFGTIDLHQAVIWIIPGWFIWYSVCSITISQVIRKALNIGGFG